MNNSYVYGLFDFHELKDFSDSSIYNKFVENDDSKFLLRCHLTNSSTELQKPYLDIINLYSKKNKIVGLILVYCGIYKFVFSKLYLHQTISILDLTGNNIFNTSMIAILLIKSNVKFLNLSYNRIEDVRPIMFVLHLSKVQYLNLNVNPIKLFQNYEQFYLKKLSIRCALLPTETIHFLMSCVPRLFREIIVTGNKESDNYKKQECLNKKSRLFTCITYCAFLKCKGYKSFPIEIYGEILFKFLN